MSSLDRAGPRGEDGEMGTMKTNRASRSYINLAEHLQQLLRVKVKIKVFANFGLLIVVVEGKSEEEGLVTARLEVKGIDRELKAFRPNKVMVVNSNESWRY